MSSNKKLVTIQKDKNGDSFIDIKNFSDFYDISKIESYEVLAQTDKSLAVVFFDKDGNKLKPIIKEQDNESKS